MPKKIDPMSIDSENGDDRYGPEGYWPYGTPCPRRLTAGRVGINIVKEKVIEHFGRVPPYALNVIMDNPAFKNCRTIKHIDGTEEVVDEHSSDIIDAISVLNEGVTF